MTTTQSPYNLNSEAGLRSILSRLWVFSAKWLANAERDDQILPLAFQPTVSPPVEYSWTPVPFLRIRYSICFPFSSFPTNFLFDFGCSLGAIMPSDGILNFFW